VNSDPLKNKMEDDETSQNDEIEALVSIYDDALTLLPSTSGKAFEIKINEATLCLNFPPNYPSDSSPSYELSAPFLNRDEKEEITDQLRDILSSSLGMPVVFSLVECLKEFLEQYDLLQKSTSNAKSQLTMANAICEEIQPKVHAQRMSSVQCPVITTGDCIEDRKSVFQGHYAHVETAEDVKAVISKLMENRKIANAAHGKIYAYRIRQAGDGKMFLQDCDDDGETHAGSRILHLLEILECENVLVVVSRWYGGAKLGPDRFKHINNSARNVLEKAGIVSKIQKKDTKNKNK